MTLITPFPADFKPANTALPIHGQQLTRKKDWLPHEREFVAADLHEGRKILIEPTLLQSMVLTGAGSTTSIWWAIQRERFRQEITAKQMPLVPAHQPRQKSVFKLVLTDEELVALVRAAGVGRVLDAAVAVENC